MMYLSCWFLLIYSNFSIAFSNSLLLGFIISLSNISGICKKFTQPDNISLKFSLSTLYFCNSNNIILLFSVKTSHLSSLFSLKQGNTSEIASFLSVKFSAKTQILIIFLSPYC